MKKFFVFFAIFVLFYSCTSVNNFENYDLSKSTVFFEIEVPAEVRNVEVVFDEVPEETTNNKKSTGDIIAGVISDLAGGFVTADVENKLRRVVKPEEIATKFSNSVMNSLIKYYQINETNDIKSNYDYISTCILNQCKMIINNNGAYLNISSENQIVNRETGDIVWRKNISNSFQIRNTNNSGSALLKSALKTIDLATISEEELAQAVNSTTNGISSDISESLRKAISSAKKGK